MSTKIKVLSALKNKKTILFILSGVVLISFGIVMGTVFSPNKGASSKKPPSVTNHQVIFHIVSSESQKNDFSSFAFLCSIKSDDLASFIKYDGATTKDGWNPKGQNKDILYSTDNNSISILDFKNGDRNATGWINNLQSTSSHKWVGFENETDLNANKNPININTFKLKTLNLYLYWTFI